MQTLPATQFQFNNAELSVTLDDAKLPWFNVNEVCAILGYTNPVKAVGDHCKPAGVSKRATRRKMANQHGPLPDQVQDENYINEANLYRLVLRSKMEAAEVFSDWVVEEVLPSIKETGIYIDKARLKLTDAQDEKIRMSFLNSLQSTNSEKGIEMASKALDEFQKAYDLPDNVVEQVENAVLFAHGANQTGAKRPASAGHNFMGSAMLAKLYGDSGEADEIDMIFLRKGFTTRTGKHTVLTQKGQDTKKGVCGPGGNGYEAVYWDHDFARGMLTQ